MNNRTRRHLTSRDLCLWLALAGVAVAVLAACLGCGGNECSPPDLIELQRELSLQEDYVRSLQIRVDAIESRMPGGGPALIPASDLPLDAELMEEQ